MTVILTGHTLTLEQLYEVAENHAKVALHPDSVKNVEKCRAYVEKIVAENRVVYGLTTGFGKFATIRIPTEQIEELQTNLIMSHATAVGAYLSEAETRAIMLLRINVLANGHSGIRLQTLQTLIDMLNAGIHPCIPEKGSVGASGDLAPLSHLALVLLGKGRAVYNGEEMTGGEAMQLAGLTPVTLKAKEGLALNNGTQVMTGITALALLKAEHLCRVADVCAAMSIDALLGTTDAFDPLIHKLRPFGGQQDSAKNITALLDGSELRESHRNCGNVQDAYSLRCTPQVHGAVREALRYVRSVLDVEINATTDNPLIFPDEDRVISGGNFHGEPVAFAADTLGFTIAELANISERRMEQMLNPALNRGLNAFLAPRPGLDSGFMIAQLTAASLISENKVMAHPASVDSIPTSANQEDHVSMGTIGAVKARNMIDNVCFVLGIELMIATQAIDGRSYTSSKALESLRHQVRKNVPFLEKDRIIMGDINSMKALIESATIPQVIQEFVTLS
ncbi:MAG: histidine ammonia-lyase [Candidatus Cloacimonetes bacterium]|nr:histidine ammonia-lyase [Candidatus Cloacimonadota bacterium]